MSVATREHQASISTGPPSEVGQARSTLRDLFPDALPEPGVVSVPQADLASEGEPIADLHLPVELSEVVPDSDLPDQPRRSESASRSPGRLAWLGKMARRAADTLRPRKGVIQDPVVHDPPLTRTTLRSAFPTGSGSPTPQWQVPVSPPEAPQGSPAGGDNLSAGVSPPPRTETRSAPDKVVNVPRWSEITLANPNRRPRIGREELFSGQRPPETSQPDDDTVQSLPVSALGDAYKGAEAKDRPMAAGTAGGDNTFGPFHEAERGMAAAEVFGVDRPGLKKLLGGLAHAEELADPLTDPDHVISDDVTPVVGDRLAQFAARELVGAHHGSDGKRHY